MAADLNHPSAQTMIELVYNNEWEGRDAIRLIGGNSFRSSSSSRIHPAREAQPRLGSLQMAGSVTFGKQTLAQ
jgi:hypothetical protein